MNKKIRPDRKNYSKVGTKFKNKVLSFNGAGHIKFYRRHWYDIGAILLVALTFSWCLGRELSFIQVILTYSLVALLVHEYEDYASPGGFPGVFNIAVIAAILLPNQTRKIRSRRSAGLASSKVPVVSLGSVIAEEACTETSFCCSP